MRSYFKDVTILLLIFIMYSCSPQSTNGLIQHSVTNGAGIKLKKKDEIKFSVNSAVPSFEHSEDAYTDFQIGYSPFKYVGVQAGHYRFHSMIRNRELSKSNVNNLSIGTYYPIDLTGLIEWLPYYPRILPDSFQVELYGGASLGKIVNKDSDDNTPEDFHVSTFRMQNYFFRTGWTYYLSNFSFNANYKWGYLNFYKGVYDYGRGTTSVFSNFNNIKEDNDVTYAEVTHQLTYNSDELQIHVGVSRVQINEPSNIKFKETIWFGGVTFDIQTILNHNKNYNDQY